MSALSLLSPLLYGGSAYALTRKPADLAAHAIEGVTLGNLPHLAKGVFGNTAPDLTVAAALGVPALVADLADDGPGTAARRALGATGGAALGLGAGLMGGQYMARENRPLAAAIAAALGAGLGAKMASEEKVAFGSAIRTALGRVRAARAARAARGPKPVLDPTHVGPKPVLDPTHVGPTPGQPPGPPPAATPPAEGPGFLGTAAQLAMPVSMMAMPFIGGQDEMRQQARQQFEPL